MINFSKLQWLFLAIYLSLFYCLRARIGKSVVSEMSGWADMSGVPRAAEFRGQSSFRERARLRIRVRPIDTRRVIGHAKNTAQLRNLAPLTGDRTQRINQVETGTSGPLQGHVRVATRVLLADYRWQPTSVDCSASLNPIADRGPGAVARKRASHWESMSTKSSSRASDFRMGHVAIFRRWALCGKFATTRL
jgi:hypothetical protein